MEALIQHFLIYSQGFTVPAGEAYVPVEGPRGEHGVLHRVGRHRTARARIKMRAGVVLRLPGAAEDDRRRHDRRRHRRHRLDRRRDGRRGSMSFHPLMPCTDRRVPSVGAHAARRRASRSRFTPERARDARGDLLEVSARAAQVGRPRGAAISCRSSRATSPRNGMRHVARVPADHAGRSRGRRRPTT